MQRSGILLLSLLLATPVLAGCLAGEETIAPAGDGSTLDTAENVPTLAVLHAAGVTNNSTTAPALPAGLPLPVGAVRYSGWDSFEPTLGVDSKGRVFLSNFDVRIPDWGLLARSDDQGLTWTDVTPRVGGVTMPPQSNDPYVFVDPDTDRIFLSDLQVLQCATLSFSDNGGESWITNPIGCGLPPSAPPHDHQTVFTAKPRLLTTVGYPKIVYYCINRVVDSTCATSLNGGLSFGPLRPLVFNGLEPCDGFISGGLHAHGTAAPDGTVYIGKAHCDVPMIARTLDDGLTWQTFVISDKVKVAPHSHEVATAADEAGNVYAFWIGEDRLPYLAVSTDQGATWTEAVMVAPPGVGTTDYPAIAAGAAGRVAFAYYGTAAAKEYGAMEDGDTWNGYIGVITDALTPGFTVATAPVNDPADPLARGVCGATRCDGPESNGVGDFIDIVIGPDGRPWAAMVDVCDAGCADGSRTIGIGIVGTLVTGPA
ncbi:MAG TPA: sialidase family protein, partial [Candidatus Thermoplasmatota archaeon]|nr:sialidase family protein [Candidatus Thermoplasmatota archaeon]